MALAAYHRRAAVAAAQVLEGFDEERFAAAVSTPVGISFGADAAACPEGRALLDLLVRLVARLYPTISIVAPEHGRVTNELIDLSRRINPEIEVGEAEIGIRVGADGTAFPTTIYAGSDGWDALVSTEQPQMIGASDNVLGAGAAACIAAANLFRAVVLPLPRLDDTVRYSTFYLDNALTAAEEAPALSTVALNRTALIGIGAIGNATVWALANSEIVGRIELVDPENVELSNLQRYVLTEQSDIGKQKAKLASRSFEGRDLKVRAHAVPLAAFLAERGTGFERLVVAVDNRRDRIAAQASLPRVALNSWTQPGDLGVSIHPRFGEGACVSCLYTGDGPVPNEDELVAQALRVPERQMEIRALLATGAPPSLELLDAVAAGLGVDAPLVRAFAGRPVRSLYVEGLCGGAILPLGACGLPMQEVHVPLAHQSALAGVLLAARLLRHAAGFGPDETLVSRFDVLRPVGVELTQPQSRLEGKRCICGDSDFVVAYREKWPDSPGDRDP
jgi:molybdopterin/thiamine biosynthesis adenylyltransferase